MGREASPRSRPSSGRTQPRLLVFDALGGPHPRRFGPSLAGLAEIELVCVLPPFSGERESRLAELARWGSVTTVDDPSQVVERALERAAGRRVDGLFAQCEPLMLAAALVADELGLPGNTVESARHLTDKRSQRETLERSGVPTPLWHAVDSPEDLAIARRAVPFPAVLKPVVGMGGVSLAIVDTPEDLPAAYASSRSHYEHDPRMRHLEPRYILEQLIAGQRWHEDPRFGDYVSVESLVWDGVVTHLAVTDKLATTFPFRETGDIVPSTLPAEVATEIRDAAAAAIAAVGMTAGAVHTEIKLTAAGPRVIEVNGRVGGPVPDLLSLAAGFDVLAELGAMALGRAPSLRPLDFARYAGYLTPQSPARPVRVRAVRGLAQARALEGVRELIVDCDVGSIPNWRMGERGRLFRSWVSAPTLDGLLKTFDALRRDLIFELEDL